MGKFDPSIWQYFQSQEKVNTDEKHINISSLLVYNGNYVLLERNNKNEPYILPTAFSNSMFRLIPLKDKFLMEFGLDIEKVNFQDIRSENKPNYSLTVFKPEDDGFKYKAPFQSFDGKSRLEFIAIDNIIGENLVNAKYLEIIKSHHTSYRPLPYK